MGNPRSFRRNLRTLALAAAAATASVAPIGCDTSQGLPAPSFVPGGEGVRLRVNNLARLTVDSEAVFFNGDITVRSTMRRLDAAGIEAIEEIVPTHADRIVVTNRIASTRSLPFGAKAGDMISQYEFIMGVDYEPNGTIVTTVFPPNLPDPPPDPPDGLPVNDFPDCNGNGFDDRDEIAEAPELDCNDDGEIDGCQDLEDCNGDGVPDVCQVLRDCNGDGIPDDCQGLKFNQDCDKNGIPDACEDPRPDCTLLPEL